MVFFRRRGRRKVAVSKSVYLPIYALYDSYNLNAGPLDNARAAIGKSSLDSNGNQNVLDTTADFYSNSTDNSGYVIYQFDIDSFLASLPEDAVLNYIRLFVTAGRENETKGSIQFNLVHRSSNGSYTVVYGTGPTAESKTSATYYVCGIAAPSKETLNQYFLEVNVERYGGHVDGGTLQINYTVYE